MAKTQFAEFLAENKIDERRLLAASKRLERLNDEDRRLKLRQRQSRNSEDAKKDEGGEKRKPRSGRPVTERALTAAKTGGSISGPARTRILRAVNHILAQRQKDPVELRTLFGFPPKGGMSDGAPV